MQADAARASPTANASPQSPATVLLSGPGAFISAGDLLQCFPIPLPPASESLFSIILIWSFIRLIWICVLQTSGGPPGSLLASTCYSAGNLCSRLGSGPAFQSWPDACIRVAQAVPPPSSPLRRGFPGPQAPKRRKDCCAQTSVTRKEADFILGQKLSRSIQ